MIRPHEIDNKKKYDLAAQAAYEEYIDNKISQHNFDEQNELVIHNHPTALAPVDRDAVLTKYTEWYTRTQDGADVNMPGWTVERSASFVRFKRPVVHS